MEITTIQTQKGLYEIIDQKEFGVYLDWLKDIPLQDEIDILEYQWILKYIF